VGLSDAARSRTSAAFKTQMDFGESPIDRMYRLDMASIMPHFQNAWG